MIAAPAAGDPCRACGACCSYDADWPRFTLETDAVIAHIPAGLVGTRGMRCIGNRCAALEGEVGRATACLVYDVRPEVCRSCLPGDEACATARRRFGLAALDPAAPDPHL